MERWVEAVINFRVNVVSEEEIQNAIKDIEEFKTKENAEQFVKLMDLIVKAFDYQNPHYLIVLNDILNLYRTRPLAVLEVTTDPITMEITEVIVIHQISTGDRNMALWYNSNGTFYAESGFHY